MAVAISAVPMQNRAWLRQFRKLKGYTLHGIAGELGMAHHTYLSVESGGRYQARKCSETTLRLVANFIGSKTDMFFHRTDAEGRLTSKASITDIFTFFATQGFKAAIHSESIVSALFAPDVAEYIFENILND